MNIKNPPCNVELDAIENNMNPDLFNRFEALLREATLLKKNIYTGSSDYVKSYLSFNEGIEQRFLIWKQNVKTLLALCFGEASVHYLNFLQAEVAQHSEDQPDIFNRLHPILLAAYEDFKSAVS